MASSTEDAVDLTVQEAPETATPTLPSSSEEGIKPLAVVGSEAVSCLSQGFLAVLEPELIRVHKSLEELV